MTNDILGNDNGGVHEHADGDGNAGQRHNVAGDAELLHQQERNQNRNRPGQGNDENAPEMPQEKDVRERDEDDFFDEGMLERVDRSINELAAIVEGFD